MKNVKCKPILIQRTNHQIIDELKKIDDLREHVKMAILEVCPPWKLTSAIRELPTAMQNQLRRDYPYLIDLENEHPQ